MPEAPAVMENEHVLVPMAKLKFPSMVGVPVPSRYMVCSPVEVKLPLVENDMPLIVLELMEYDPIVVTITFIEMVLAAVSDMPAV